MFKRENKLKPEEKFIDMKAGLEGSVKFNGPVNLRISGKFEGELEAEGTLIIGEKAEVKTKIIKGENITVAGKVKGDIKSSKRLELSAPAKVIGNIETPVLVINEGAVLKGNCQMSVPDEKGPPRKGPKKKSHPKKK